MGHASVAVSLLHLAAFAEARAQFELALAIDGAREPEWTHLYGQSGRVTALAYMSLDVLLLGFPDAAQRLAEQSVEEARRLAHPTSLCFAHSIASRAGRQESLGSTFRDGCTARRPARPQPMAGARRHLHRLEPSRKRRSGRRRGDHTHGPCAVPRRRLGAQPAALSRQFGQC
jgi:hypothetical protein